MSNSRPSRPTRRCRKRIGLPSVTSVPSAAANMIGAASRMAKAAITRSRAYLSLNCQPRGFDGKMPSRGRPPTRSTFVRSGMSSNRRGTTETDTPRRRSRRITSSSSSWEAVEKHRIACSMAFPRTSGSIWDGGPSTGQSLVSGTSRGSVSTKPTGRRPICGRSSSRLASRWPTRPAPTISVGLPA